MGRKKKPYILARDGQSDKFENMRGNLRAESNEQLVNGRRNHRQGGLGGERKALNRGLRDMGTTGTAKKTLMG